MLSSFLGRLQTLHSRSARKPADVQNIALFLHGRAEYTIDVVGVSRYQPELLRAIGGIIEARQNYPCIASLVLSSGKPYEKNSVIIEIQGKAIGYFPNHLATQYREWLQKWQFSGAQVGCNALVTGGAHSNDGQMAAATVKLDVEVPFKVTATSLAMR